MGFYENMKKKEKILDEVYKKAFKYESEQGSCPQCVLATLFESFNISDPETIKAIDSLADGTSLSTEGTCGALIGGLVAISSILGRNYDDFKDGERKRLVFKYSKKLYEKFINEYGSPICKKVHKKIFGRTFNLLDQKEYQEFEKAGAHVDKCTKISGKVAKWTAEIIIDDLKKYINQK
jgi:C_GCAxxG_C_C family probable redox protein